MLAKKKTPTKVKCLIHYTEKLCFALWKRQIFVWTPGFHQSGAWLPAVLFILIDDGFLKRIIYRIPVFDLSDVRNQRCNLNLSEYLNGPV